MTEVHAVETLTELYLWLNQQQRRHVEVLRMFPTAVDQQQALLAYRRTQEWLEAKRHREDGDAAVRRAQPSAVLVQRQKDDENADWVEVADV